MTGTINSNAQGTWTSTYEAKPGSKALGSILESAGLNCGEIKALNASDYPNRAIKGSTLLLSSPLLCLVSPLAPVVGASLCGIACSTDSPRHPGSGASLGGLMGSALCLGPIPSAIGGSGLISSIRPA